MDLISELNSEIALAVLVEGRHRQKVDLRKAIDVMWRVNSALEPLSDSNEQAARSDLGGFPNSYGTPDSYL